MSESNTLSDNYQNSIIWLDKYGSELSKITYCEAAEKGYLEVMKI